MISIIKQPPKRGLATTTIRASWLCVQRALADQQKARSTRFRHLDMTGEANLLHTGAKAIHKGNGIWLVLGYAADGRDIDAALDTMRKPWEPRHEQV